MYIYMWEGTSRLGVGAAVRHTAYPTKAVGVCLSGVRMSEQPNGPSKRVWPYQIALAVAVLRTADGYSSPGGWCLLGVWRALHSEARRECAGLPAESQQHDEFDFFFFFRSTPCPPAAPPRAWRILMSSCAMVRNACSTLSAFFADVSS